MTQKANHLIKAANQAIQSMKYETAQELGITPPENGYWGHLTTRENGAIGGSITQKLVALAEQHLSTTQTE